MNRSKFIKISALGMATSIAGPKFWISDLMANTYSKDQLFYALLESNDKGVGDFLSLSSDKTKISRSRYLAAVFSEIAASYCVEESRHYRSEAALKRLEEIIGELFGRQYPNGTLDSGGNLQSPPDTAFLIEHLGPAATVLRQLDSSQTEALNVKLSCFLKNVGEGLISGGIHTPNHRWVVSAALARLYTLRNTTCKPDCLAD